MTKVLPTSVPVAVTKIATTASAFEDAGADDAGEPRDFRVRMRGAEGEAQARGARGHGRRPDGDGEKALVLQ